MLAANGGVEPPKSGQIYGQSQYNISQLQSYLNQFGITTQVYPDDVDVVATGTAGEFDSALAVQQQQYYVPELQREPTPGRELERLPGSVGIALRLQHPS